MKRIVLGFLVLGAVVLAFGEETIYDPTRPVSMLGQIESLGTYSGLGKMSSCI